MLMRPKNISKDLPLRIFPPQPAAMPRSFHDLGKVSVTSRKICDQCTLAIWLPEDCLGSR